MNRNDDRQLRIGRSRRVPAPRPYHLYRDGEADPVCGQPVILESTDTIRRPSLVCSECASSVSDDPLAGLTNNPEQLIRPRLLRPHHLPLHPYRDSVSDWQDTSTARFRAILHAARFRDRRNLDTVRSETLRRQLRQASILSWTRSILGNAASRTLQFFVLHASPSFFAEHVPNIPRTAHRTLIAPLRMLRPVSPNINQLAVINQLINCSGVRPVAERLLRASSEQGVPCPALRIMLDNPSFFVRLRRRTDQSDWEEFYHEMFGGGRRPTTKRPETYYHELYRTFEHQSAVVEHRSDNLLSSEQALRKVARNRVLHASQTETKLSAFRAFNTLNKPRRVRYTRHRSDSAPEWVRRLFERLNQRHLNGMLPARTPIARNHRSVVASAINHRVGRYYVDGEEVEYRRVGIDLSLPLQSVFLPGVLLHEMVHLSVRHVLTLTTRSERREHGGLFQVYARLTDLPFDGSPKYWPMNWERYRPWACRQLRTISAPHAPILTDRLQARPRHHSSEAP